MATENVHTSMSHTPVELDDHGGSKERAATHLYLYCHRPRSRSRKPGADSQGLTLDGAPKRQVVCSEIVTFLSRDTARLGGPRTLTRPAEADRLAGAGPRPWSR
jgi:hypothetical protein